MLLPINNKQ